MKKPDPQRGAIVLFKGHAVVVDTRIYDDEGNLLVVIGLDLAPVTQRGTLGLYAGPGWAYLTADGPLRVVQLVHLDQQNPPPLISLNNNVTDGKPHGR